VADFTIEPGGSKAGRCPACGSPATVAHGYVYANADAYAVYFIDWCEHHEDPRQALLTVSAGNWGEGARSAERFSVCLAMRAAGLVLAEQPARERPKFFGRFLAGPQALEYAASFALAQVAERILAEDPHAGAVMAWVAGDSDRALLGADG
jgi:hypothetical protein